MIGSFEQTLALRYLRGADGREGGAFLRFVIVAAVGGVALGTGALLLALMIVRGFSSEIEAKIVGFGQHVQVESYLGEPLTGADSLAARLLRYPGVVAAAPAVVDFALVRGRSDAGSAVDGVLLWGTEASAQPFIRARTGLGAFDFAPDAAGRPGLVVGARLAERLGLEVGEAVTVFSTRGLRGDAPVRPQVKALHVAGVFETGLADFDDQFAYAPLAEVRDLFAFAPDQATRVDLTLADRLGARDLALQISDEVGPPVIARSIEDVYRGLFAWVELQQSIVPLVISILVVVAAFNIIGALLMVVLEKAREIGTVLAMGASRRAVRRLFLLFGFLVGTVGAALGAALALGFGWAQKTWQFIPLPQDAYYLDAAPIQIEPLDVVVTVVVAVVLCTLAAYLPARAAARVEPIRTIRFGA